MASPPESIGVPPRVARAGARVAEAALLVGGVALLVALVRRIGAAPLLHSLRLVGAGMILIVGQEILAIVANTLGWRSAFPARATPPITRLLGARIAGDAVNYVTPTATIGGELVRARLLRGRAAGLDVAASLAVAKVAQTLAQVGFVAVGCVLVVATMPLARAARVALSAAAAAMCAVAAGVLIAQRRGMFSPLLALAARFDRRGQLAELRRRARRLDAEIADVHRAGGRFVASCGWFFVGWALGAVEIALMLWLLGVPVGISRPLTIEVLSVGVDALSFFVPAKLGTQEGGKVLVFTTLGLDATLGLSVGVLRRLRELAWALLGFAIVARASLAGQLAGEPAGAPPMRLVAD